MIIIDNFIWIFGENLGKTANDNSYYLWKHIVNIDDGIDKFLVLDKNESTSKIYDSLSANERKFVLWKNSYEHFNKFIDADLFFVTRHYTDVTPDKLFVKEMKMRLKKPFIHLQSGAIGLKKLNELGFHYGNNILRLFVYNKEIMDTLKEKNDFRSYQLKYSKYQPKTADLFRADDDKQILWYLDNRLYFDDDFLNVKSFSTIIKRIVEDSQVIDYLKENGLKFKICTHGLMSERTFQEFSTFNNEFIEVVKHAEINLQEEIAKSKLFISDYSPSIYDAALIGKPYIVFQPDINRFVVDNDFYYDDDFKKFIINRPSQLIDVLVNEDYGKHDYIENALPQDIDIDYLKRDGHLDDFYNYFKNLQLNKITFLGYNFYGLGGTVNATMALVESLLQQDYWVEVMSLRRLSKIRHIPPYGLTMQYITWDNSGSIKEKINRKRYSSPKYYSYLEEDYVKKFLPPYAGYKMTDLMTNIRTNTLVSTRETLHLFLNDCTSEHVTNKIFFFHTPADMIENVFPGLMDKLKDINIDKAVFITNQNRLGLERNYNYTNYERYINLGNTLTMQKRIEKDEIQAVEKKDKYHAIYLLRISQGRKDDLDNLIEFGKYVKENNIDFIDIDVFGDGDYVDEFINLVESNDLSNIIHYKFSTETPIEEIRNHDLMIDFSLNHSFGMIYIEAVLNGKKVFCMENIGSTEVMGEIPNSYIESYEWLTNQIENLDSISADELKENYDKIGEKYSQEVIANEFLRFVEEE